LAPCSGRHIHTSSSSRVQAGPEEPPQVGNRQISMDRCSSLIDKKRDSWTGWIQRFRETCPDSLHFVVSEYSEPESRIIPRLGMNSGPESEYIQPNKCQLDRTITVSRRDPQEQPDGPPDGGRHSVYFVLSYTLSCLAVNTFAEVYWRIQQTFACATTTICLDGCQGSRSSFLSPGCL
jgi:hypothetical protein